MSQEVVEIIEISDEEEEEYVAHEALSWPSVVSRLLLLARDREQLDEAEEITRLLHDMGISNSITLHSALKKACKLLGDLLEIAGERPRKRRASEALAIVLCEVLSLAQDPAVEVKVEEVDLTDPIQELLTLMKKWRGLLSELLKTEQGREAAVGRTIARLEGLVASCGQEMHRIDSSIGIHLHEKEVAAEKWQDTMAKCCDGLAQLDLGSVEGSIQLYSATYSKTRQEQSDYEMHRKQAAELKRQKRDMEARQAFFNAALALVFPIVDIRQQFTAGSQDTDTHQSGADVFDAVLGALSNDILLRMDMFCSALNEIMAPSRSQLDRAHDKSRSTSGDVKRESTCSDSERSAEIFGFSKQLELFWLTYRNQLPVSVLDVAAHSFDSLSKINGHEEGSVNTVVARLSYELGGCSAMKASP